MVTKRVYRVMGMVAAITFILTAIIFLFAKTKKENNVYATDGVLNIEKMDLSTQVAMINGFDFYPERLYKPGDFHCGNVKTEDKKDEGLGLSTDYGTYRLEVKGKAHQMYQIAGQSTNYSMRVFINGLQYIEYGNVSENEYATDNQTGFLNCPVMTDDNGYAEIIIQYANFTDDKGSGIINFNIADAKKMQDYIGNLYFNIVFWGGGLIIIGLYFIVNVIIHKRIDYLMLSICCIIVGLREQNLFFAHFIPTIISWNIKNRIYLVIAGMLPGAIGMLISKLYPRILNRKAEFSYMLAWLISEICYMFMPLKYIDNISCVYFVFTIPYFIYCMYSVSRRFNKTEGLKKLEKNAAVIFSIFFIFACLELVRSTMNVTSYDYRIVSVGMVVFVILIGVAINNNTYESEFMHDRAKNTEEMNHKMNELKMRFFKNMVHEMKTPLTVMSGYAQLTKMQIQNDMADQETIDNLDVIVSESLRLSDMVKKLLESGDLVADNTFIEEVDVDEMLREVLAVCRQICKQNKNDIRILTKYRYTVMGNREMLIRVLLNIITNGSRHTNDGRIDIVVNDIDEQLVEFRISNDGEPIDKEDAKHIFEEGYSPDGGTGLGLGICRELVENMNGSIELIDSEERTTFSVKVPMWRE